MNVNIFNLNNMLDQIPISKIEVENQIRSFNLEFIQVRDYSVEWLMNFPMFVPSFYEYIIDSVRIPTQSEYWFKTDET